MEKNVDANHRPISLISVLCNILARIGKAKILQCLKRTSLFSDAKHDFILRRSYPSNLIIAEAVFTIMTDQV